MRIIALLIFIIFSNLKISSQYINWTSFRLTREYIINDYALVIGDGLRVRKEENLKSEIVDKLKFGDTVKVLEVKYSADREYEATTVNGIENFWWKVETKKGIVGYAFAEYLAYPYYKIGDYNYLYIKWEVKDNLKYNEYDKRKVYIPIAIYKNGKKLYKYQLWYKIQKNSNEIDISIFNTHGPYFICSPTKIGIKYVRNDLFTLYIEGLYERIKYDTGGAGGYFGEVWFKIYQEKIEPVFTDIRIYLLNGFDYGDILTYYFDYRDSNNNIDKINQIINFLPKYISYSEFTKLILDKVTNSEKDLILKYYYQLFYKKHDDLFYIKEAYYKERDKLMFQKNKFKLTEQQTQILDKVISDKNVICKDENLKSIFVKINFNPGFALIKDFNLDDIKKVREIFKKINYSWDEGNNYTFNWDKGEYKFIGEKN